MSLKRILKNKINSIKCRRNHVPGNCIIHYSCRIRGTVMEGKNKLSRGAKIEHGVMGYASYMGMNGDLTGCRVGKYCSIAQNVKVITGQHPVRTFISTHPFFYSREFGEGGGVHL